MNLEERLYTSTEVAKILGVSLRSVYRYLDQGKLDAEIKTATGRLRFTKKDILNFLYPDGDVDPSVLDSRFSQLSAPSDDMSSPKFPLEPASIPQPYEARKTARDSWDFRDYSSFRENYSPSSSKYSDHQDQGSSRDTDIKGSKEDREQVDWLEKFRRAAQDYAPTYPSKEKEYDLTFGTEQREEEPEGVDINEEEGEMPKVKFTYYKSAQGGLKEIAQNIDKIARKSAVDYAFTLYAGLSLDKPLKKPFSILHVYINPATEDLFRKMLQLEETNESNAQLCIMYPQDPSVFANKVEKHGLYVVDSEQLRRDFESMGLVEEMSRL